MKLNQLKEQENRAPEIIVMVGLPASGKSTWRDKMVSKSDVDYVIISSDDEIERLAGADGLDYSQGFKKYIGQATSITKEKFQEAVNNNRSIIWDQTNLNPKKRKTILRQVPEHYHKIAVVFEVTEQELNDRLKKRERETGKHIPDKVIKDMARSYVPPTKQEGFDQVVFA